jgi:hypothetical protein
MNEKIEFNEYECYLAMECDDDGLRYPELEGMVYNINQMFEHYLADGRDENEESIEYRTKITIKATDGILIFKRIKS